MHFFMHKRMNALKHKDSRNSIKEYCIGVEQYDAHPKSVFKKRNLRFGKDSSFPSNVHRFCSIQLRHIRQTGTAL